MCDALKHLAALHLHPILIRKPPLSCPTGAFIKDNDRCAAPVSSIAWARGGGGLGGSFGAQEGGTSTLHPLDPWHVLKLYFLDVSMLLAFGLPTRPLLPESDRLRWLLRIQSSSVGPLFCARVLS